MKVTVIGCGPAGLAVAHAAAGQGCDVRIIGPKVKTPQRGPIMLHRPIPGINTEQPTGYVRQIVIGGSILDYRLKTYGDINVRYDYNGQLEEGFHTWPVPEAYDRMWELYSHLIEDRAIWPDEVSGLCDEADLVVSTAPLKNLCLNTGNSMVDEPKHKFNSFPVALTNGTSYPDQPDNTVIYNARPDIKWVRSSSIFGARVTEWQVADCPKPDLIIRKPLSTDCDCHPRMLRTGRFGKWHNETWIDHAYYEALSTVVSMKRAAEWAAIV